MNYTKFDGKGVDMAAEELEKLKSLFPQCIVEGKLDWEKLRALCGEYVDDKKEKYRFEWVGKQRCHQIVNSPIWGTLRPCKNDSVDWEKTNNLYIEGDNLEVLRLLLKSYRGKVKMIYIDPPYNTGKDFIYEDNFIDPLKAYLEQTGQTTTANPNTAGRYHTKWLNMMYPRLLVAREMLCDDGIVFISIDENEIHNLSRLCDDVFGSENNLKEIVWDKRNPKGEVKGLAQQHEYIVVCVKNTHAFSSQDYFYRSKEHAGEMIKKAAKLFKKHNGDREAAEKEFQRWLKTDCGTFSGGELAYRYIDDNGEVYQPVSMAAPDKPETRSHRPLLHPVTQKECPVPAKGWRYPDATMDNLIAEKRIVFGKDEKTQPRCKYYLRENLNEAVPSVLYYGGSDTAMDVPFDNPKPVYLLKRLLESGRKDDIIMDFFSGSASTAHAMFTLNAQDFGTRRFIMVQLPENLDKSLKVAKKPSKSQIEKAIEFLDNINKPHLLTEIGKERIRRAGEEVKKKAMLAGLNLDTGFRVFKLESSNFRKWDGEGLDESKEQMLLDRMEGRLQSQKEGRTEDDIVYELMLKQGVELTENIEILDISGHKVYYVANMFICLDMSMGGMRVEDFREMVKQRECAKVIIAQDAIYDDATLCNIDNMISNGQIPEIHLEIL